MPERLALAHGEAHAVHRLAPRPSGCGAARAGRAPRGRSRWSSRRTRSCRRTWHASDLLSQARVEPVAQPVAEEVKASTTSMIASPGNIDIHQALGDWPRPSATIWPHDGVGGGMPGAEEAQRRLHDDDEAECSVSSTMNVFRTLGRMWTAMMRRCEQPRTRASATKSRVLTVSTSPRTTRAKRAQMMTAIAMHDRAEPRAQTHRQQQREEDRGKGERGVDDAHEDESIAAADVAGDDADPRARSRRPRAARQRPR